MDPMSAAPPYMRLYWGDYFRDTRRLNRLEHSAYLLLIGELWVQGGVLDADDDTLARAALCTPEEWAEVKPIVMGFFTVSRGRLKQKRLSEELAKYEDTIGKRRAAGKAGGNAKACNNRGNPLADAKETPSVLLHNHNHNQNQNHKEEEAKASLPKPSARKETVYPEAFGLAWKAYPHEGGRSSKPDSLKEWLKLPTAEQDGLVGAITRMRPDVEKAFGGKGAPDMARWLKAGKHLSYPAPESIVPEFEWTGPAWIKAEAMNHADHRKLSAYLDRCDWVPEGNGGRVTHHRSVVTEFLQKELGRRLADQGVTISLLPKVPA
jgi:uncharacterized protein YdaU (DUF1376 family)